MVGCESYTISGSPLVVSKVYPFRIGFLNDIHVGSRFGLFPRDGWVDRYGNKCLPNKEQEILLDYLDDYIKKCNEVKINQLWVPGDLTAGNNRGEAGKYILNIELDDQAEIAAKVIADFCERVPSIEKVYVWDSTQYHDSKESSIGKQVVMILNSKYKVDAEYKNEYSIIRLKYKDRVKKIFITHHASSASMYPEQVMGKDIMLWEMGVTRRKLEPVDIIIRADKHNFTEVHKPSMRAIQLPAWQMFVPYPKALKNFSLWQPDIGSVILLFDEKLRVSVWHFIYDSIMPEDRFIDVNVGVEKRCLL